MRSTCRWMITLVALTAVPVHVHAEASQETYVDRETGFTITCPVGWKRGEPAIPVPGIKAAWSLSGLNDIPYMSVNMTRFQGTPTPQLFAQMTLTWGLRKEPGFRMIGMPTDLTINGVPCVRIISEATVPDENGRPLMLRSHTYYFVKAINPASDGNPGIQVLFSDSADHFPNIEEAIIQSLNTIQFKLP